MVQISIQKLNEVELDDLADFIFNNLQATAFRSENRTNDSVKKSLEEAAEDESSLVIVAREMEHNRIVGCLKFYVGFPAMAFMDSWHPLVTLSEDRDAIARQLIREFTKYAQDSGIKRVEALLSPINEAFKELQIEYRQWFLSQGFYLATEEVFMELNLEEFNLPKSPPKIANGYKFDNLENWRNEKFRNQFFETFIEAAGRLFPDMTDEQRQTTFNYWFRRSDPLHRSSLVVIKNEEVIGFSVARPDEDSVEIGPFGIHPEHAGKGIGKALLYRMITLLLDDGLGLAKLEADVENTPALNLYRKFGFEEKKTQEYYAWRVD
ncbi:MAG: GNAT family N-acetyltransferase [Candidatus Thorarchaeota archaeon]